MTTIPFLPRFKAAALTLIVAGSLGACAVDSNTGDRTLTGAAVGAASGAAVGLIRGDFLSSTLTGAAAGGAGGFVYDQIEKR
ncbi:YMGG-like glycine zipper-containing protein [Marinivivus vitaminiproducens]|uniref:YMGG-like glycine zipper-containing protein n=1 Tax=Marinivivus vitaminiproducens TaxID=3035935 RepID=UPI00279F3026|nr:hypothetical protein P4R82_05210 [Geminicoccaceae bacterium SCSIO 64248]